MHRTAFNRRTARSLVAVLGALAAAGCGGSDNPRPPPDAAPDVVHFKYWATYTIKFGHHDATLDSDDAENPIRGLVEAPGRDYDFAFDGSAIYELVAPTQPDDQLDWNKLPGLSDCGDFDLSKNGAMFGWRWRLDLDPPVLEVTAYANDNGVHLTPAQALFTLDEADLVADTPITYRLWPDGDVFRFEVSGTVRGRAIAAATTLPRACAATSVTKLKWAAGLYFGGTSVAPSEIRGRIHERAFVTP